MSAPVPPTTAPRRVSALVATSAVLLLVSGALSLLTDDADAALAPAALVREAHEHLLPALAAPAGASWLQHLALARGWGVFGIAFTGFWDARVLALVALVLAGGGLATLLCHLGRLASPRRLAFVALAGLGLELIAARVASGTGAHALAHAWLWLTLLQLSLTDPDRSPRARLVGWLAGALNLAASSLGFAAALAVLARDLKTRAPRPQLVASSVLAALGAATVFSRSGGGETPAAQVLAATFTYPFGSPWFALFVWAPTAIALWHWLRRGEAGASLNLAAPLALAFLGATLGFAVIGSEPPVAWLALGLLVNVVALAALPWTPGAARARQLGLAAVWVIGVANALAQPLASPPQGKYEPVAETDDDRARPAAAALRAQPQIRAVLPPPLRPTLKLAAVSGAFATATPAGLPSPDGLPFLTSWSATSGAAAQGEYRSGLLTTRAAVLQVRVAGTLRPPETELLLVTESGREVAPLDSGFTVENRWKRLNFPAPGEPFHLVARDRSVERWLGFTAPLEMSRIGWFATKVARAWGWWIAVGALGAAAAIGLGWSGWRPTLTRDEWRLAPWLALAAYALFYLPHVDNTAGPNDAGGYLNFAKTLTHGAVADDIKSFGPDFRDVIDPRLHIPTTAKIAPDGHMAPEYPPGLGLMIALLALVMPLAQASVVMFWLHLLGVVLITRHLARVFGLSDPWAWLAGGIMGLSSVFLFQTLQPQSDGVSTFWVTLAVTFAWTSREHARHAFIAGAATAIAVLVRPANALCVLPVFACLWNRPLALRNLILAGLPAALWLMWFNLRSYGHPFLTGYGDISSGWALSYVGPTLVSYAKWLPVMFTPVIVLAFGAPWIGGFAPRARLILGLWAGVYFGFYAAYWCTYDNWYNMRFVLPAMPAVLVLGLYVCRDLLARTRLTIFPPDPERAPLWPSVTLCVLLLGIVIGDTAQRRVVYWAHASRAHRVAADWLRDHAPADAIVLARHASNSVWHYTDFLLVRPDQAAVREPDFLLRLARTGRPIYSINQHWERKNFEWGHGKGDGLPDLPGDWERLAVLWEGEYIVWRWHPPKAATR